jgi:phosphoribosylaminoimidazolecarboxamide formyltransferase/IMP cyclohydrolase
MIQAGKHPGKTNLTDLDNGLNIIKYLMDRPAAVILKHNNPCGVAYGRTVSDAYDKANMADRIAAFGGCLVVNRPLDKEAAELVNSNYLEVVGAPDYEEGVIDILAKRKNLRIVRIGKIQQLAQYTSFRFTNKQHTVKGRFSSCQDGL